MNLTLTQLLRFSFFFGTIALLLCALTYIAITRRIPFSARAKRRLKWFFSLCAFLFIFGPIGGRFLHFPPHFLPNTLLQWTQYYLLGLLASLLLVFLILEFTQKLMQLLVLPFDSKKRIFLTEGVARGVIAGTSALSLVGLAEANAGPNVVSVKITLETLPKAFSGLKIAQLSDVHIGPLIRKPYLEQVVEKVNSLKADLVFITGDLVDGTTLQLQDEISVLKNLKSTHGTFFCTGNHEYYSGVEEWIDYLESIGIHVFKNSNIVLKNPAAPSDPGLLIGGIFDHQSEKFHPTHVANPELAATSHEPVACKILLAHNPLSIEGAARAGFHLQLSGHTHAGQFYPFTFLVKLVLKHTEGLYQINADTKLYVNRGTGYWGPPNRLGKRAEITELTLLSH